MAGQYGTSRYGDTLYVLVSKVNYYYYYYYRQLGLLGTRGLLGTHVDQESSQCKLSLAHVSQVAPMSQVAPVDGIIIIIIIIIIKNVLI